MKLSIKEFQDVWEVVKSDCSFGFLYETLEAITDNTHIINMSTEDIQLFTLNEIKKCKKGMEVRQKDYYCWEKGAYMPIPTIDGKLVHDLYMVSGYIHGKAATEASIICFSAEDTPEKIILELEKSKMMFIIGDNKTPFLTTKKVLTTLSQRAGSKQGDFAMRDEKKIRFHRDAGYVAYLTTVRTQCQVLYRAYGEHGEYQKIFAVFSDKYKMFPQYPIIKDLIERFVEEMGTAHIHECRIDNFNTDILLEFPEKAEDFNRVYQLPKNIIPGIHIHLSDTGDSSFVCDGTARLGYSYTYVPGATYQRAHTKNADIEDIFYEVEKRIFSEYTKVPERLVELLMIDIQRPGDLIPDIVKHCQFQTALNKTVSADIEAEMIATFGYTPTTAYEIATEFLEIEKKYEEGKTNSNVLSKIRSAFMNAVFFKY